MKWIVGLSGLAVWGAGILFVIVGFRSTDIQIGMGFMSIGIGASAMGIGHLIGMKIDEQGKTAGVVSTPVFEKIRARVKRLLWGLG